ncbi:MAG: electron transfer flavoprotein subunit alpha/FixB family protein, partial [Gemmatimonadetes bacterium]|nr:electron transfer flavoprotein subunit alpha/FixB family protein [Gemmatimonadota bacterium]
MNGVLVVAELKGGEIRGASREAVSAGRLVAQALGGPVHAAVCGGSGSGEAASGLGAQGASVVHGIESPDLEAYHGSAFAESLAELVRGEGYEVVLLSATAQGRDLAPRLAARLGVPLLTDATGLDASGGNVLVTRPVYAGKAMARVRSEGTPVVVSLRPNTFPATDAAATPEVRVSAPTSHTEWGAYRPGAFEASGDALVDVSEASVIVSGGRGMKGPEHWGVLQ